VLNQREQLTGQPGPLGPASLLLLLLLHLLLLLLLPLLLIIVLRAHHQLVKAACDVAPLSDQLYAGSPPTLHKIAQDARRCEGFSNMA
jgi:hypothetical protein